MKKKIKDLVAQKEQELALMEQESEHAVQAMYSSLENMNRVNTQIESKMVEIDDYQARLGATKTALSARHQKNQRIIANLKGFLCED